MQASRGEEIYLLLILDLGTRWATFYPCGKYPGTLIGDWVGHRPGLDAETREKIRCRDRAPVVQFIVRYNTRGSQNGARVVCTRHIFILEEIYMYILVGTFLG
jgi:hypothetical protein